MISITSAPEAPPPRIRILDSRAREVETVRIGDKLTFRIEIPEDSEYTNISLAQSTGVYHISLWTNYRNIIFFRQWSTVRNICKELRGHGQGFEEHVPDHRWRRVSSGPDHIPRFLARRKRTAIRLRSVPVHGVIRRDIPVQR